MKLLCESAKDADGRFDFLFVGLGSD